MKKELLKSDYWKWKKTNRNTIKMKKECETRKEYINEKVTQSCGLSCLGSCKEQQTCILISNYILQAIIEMSDNDLLFALNKWLLLQPVLLGQPSELTCTASWLVFVTTPLSHYEKAIDKKLRPFVFLNLVFTDLVHFQVDSCYNLVLQWLAYNNNTKTHARVRDQSLLNITSFRASSAASMSSPENTLSCSKHLKRWR